MQASDRNKFMNELMFVFIIMGMMCGVLGVACFFISLSPFSLFGFAWGILLMVCAIWCIGYVVPKLEEVKHDS